MWEKDATFGIKIPPGKCNVYQDSESMKDTCLGVLTSSVLRNAKKNKGAQSFCDLD